ncbi:hypothetical protein [Leptotrichia buccalis]|uniref:Uncharacterized protein n=1 Tax=Leptotrichia buccalis (strain ATCC 14201 / DSM 1135 / JCM 12969 / NCTC 10249 / C-1013-b) TaxID=523794 RepID=C7N9N5_LEPBD|nr:hypothetical protein [Leptotrichia buccalis]ACV38866.1 hypothetical protein Lebu_0964 [Leptotrichia buccalis C-1013-b]
MKKIIFFLILMTVISINSFSGMLGGGATSDYWQMKTYFESVAINAQTLKSLNAQLKEIERQIELSKKLPEEYLKKYISQYDDTIKTLVSITNTTKSTLRDAKKLNCGLKTSMLKQITDNIWLFLTDLQIHLTISQRTQ